MELEMMIEENGIQVCRVYDTFVVNFDEQLYHTDTEELQSYAESGKKKGCWTKCMLEEADCGRIVIRFNPVRMSAEKALEEVRHLLQYIRSTDVSAEDTSIPVHVVNDAGETVRVIRVKDSKEKNFSVRLTDSGMRKNKVVSAIVVFTSHSSSKEASELLRSIPCTIAENVTKAKADEIVYGIQMAGGDAVICVRE